MVNTGELEKEAENMPDDQRANIMSVIRINNGYRWWESSNPAEVALNQLFEPIKIVDSDVFQEGLIQLFGREVDPQLAYCMPTGLKKEIVDRLKGGLNENVV